MPLANDIQKDLVHASSAWQAFMQANIDFTACCEKRDWNGAEEARQRALGALDSYYDCLAAPFKRLESEPSGK